MTAFCVCETCLSWTIRWVPRFAFSQSSWHARSFLLDPIVALHPEL